MALMYRQSGLSQLLYSVQFIMFMVSGPPAAWYKNLAVHLLPGSRISRSACCPVQESRGPPAARFKNLAVRLLPGTRISRSVCCPVQESRSPPAAPGTRISQSACCPVQESRSVADPSFFLSTKALIIQNNLT